MAINIDSVMMHVAINIDSVMMHVAINIDSVMMHGHSTKTEIAQRL